MLRAAARSLVRGPDGVASAPAFVGALLQVRGRLLPPFASSAACFMFRRSHRTVICRCTPSNRARGGLLSLARSRSLSSRDVPDTFPPSSADFPVAPAEPQLRSRG